MALPANTLVTQNNLGVINMGRAYIYESKRDTFLSWDQWVITFGTDEELDLYENPNSSAEDKELLYQKWIKDQQIVKLTEKSDGVVVQTMSWDPDSM